MRALIFWPSVGLLVALVLLAAGVEGRARRPDEPEA